MLKKSLILFKNFDNIFLKNYKQKTEDLLYYGYIYGVIVGDEDFGHKTMNLSKLYVNMLNQINQSQSTKYIFTEDLLKLYNLRYNISKNISKTKEKYEQHNDIYGDTTNTYENMIKANNELYNDTDRFINHNNRQKIIIIQIFKELVNHIYSIYNDEFIYKVRPIIIDLEYFFGLFASLNEKSQPTINNNQLNEIKFLLSRLDNILLSMTDDMYLQYNNIFNNIQLILQILQKIE
jgi:hypothetical protein